MFKRIQGAQGPGCSHPKGCFFREQLGRRKCSPRLGTHSRRRGSSDATSDTTTPLPRERLGRHKSSPIQTQWGDATARRGSTRQQRVALQCVCTLRAWRVAYSCFGATRPAYPAGTQGPTHPCQQSKGRPPCLSGRRSCSDCDPRCAAWTRKLPPVQNVLPHSAAVVFAVVFSLVVPLAQLRWRTWCERRVTMAFSTLQPQQTHPRQAPYLRP